MIKILLIGESCEDEFIYCYTDRLSPEAPVPVVIPKQSTYNKGMSGNVLENLMSLDSNIKITHWTQKNKIKKIRYVDKKSNHMFLRVDYGDCRVDKFKTSKDKIKKCSKFDIVIVSDYNKGFLTNEDILLIGKNSKLSILDSKRKISDEIVNSYTYVKLNEKEFDNNKHLNNLKNILITLGPLGTKFNDVIYKSKSPKETIDVSGAGDTFTSSFIWKFFKTKKVSESIKFANKMSSIVVSKKGVSVPK